MVAKTRITASSTPNTPGRVGRERIWELKPSGQSSKQTVQSQAQKNVTVANSETNSLVTKQTMMLLAPRLPWYRWRPTNQMTSEAIVPATTNQRSIARGQEKGT